MLKITKRQYDIIMSQAQAAYPQECGGILGGREDTVLGVLPIVNKDFSNPEVSYGISLEDLQRAGQFLQKHGLEYLGVYHSHPKGAAFPSQQDLSNYQKYHFIIGLSDRYNPELRVYRLEDNKLYAEPIRIVDDMGYTVVDISSGKPLLSENVSREEMNKLAQMIDDYIHRRLSYSKMEPIWDSSSFSTLA